MPSRPPWIERRVDVHRDLDVEERSGGQDGPDQSDEQKGIDHPRAAHWGVGRGEKVNLTLEGMKERNGDFNARSLVFQLKNFLCEV